MPFWIYGRDAATGGARDPLFIETENEEDARRQAAEAGLEVDEVERVHPSAPVQPAEEPTLFAGARRTGKVIITTTPSVEGKRIIRHCGVVTGEAILGANIFNRFLATITEVIGGRSAAYEGVLGKARNKAFDDMEQAALELGANAVVGVDLDYEMVGEGMLMICISGTAVIIV